MNRFVSHWIVMLVAAVLTQSASQVFAGDGMFQRWMQKATGRPAGPVYKPSNVYRASDSLPADLRRVALMPLLLGSPFNTQSIEGKETLEPLVAQELTHTLAFEVVAVSSRDLLLWTGHARWNPQQPLPASLIRQIQDRYACQAVVFVELTHFHGYSPMQIGWRMKLVDTRRSENVWAVDEVFDAGQPAVSNAARKFAGSHQAGRSGSNPTETAEALVLNSPRLFGQYTLSAVFSTLPSR